MAGLRGFEMVSGLKVNYHKSSLIGVNVPRDFMEAACAFLHVEKGVFRLNIWGFQWERIPKRCLLGNQCWNN